MINGIDEGRKIVVGIPTNYTYFFIKNVLPVLQNEYTNINFEVSSSRSRTIKRSIEEGKTDIGIMALEIESDSDIILWEEDIIWVCSKNFNYNSFEQLPIALFSDDCLINTYSLYYLRKSNIKFDVTFSSRTLDNITEIVEQELAASLLPQSNINTSLKKIPSKVLDCNEKLKIRLVFNSNMSKNLIKSMSILIKSVYEKHNKINYTSE